MDSLKTWVAQVILKRAVPAAITAGLAAFTALLTAHAAILQKIGLIYDPAGQTLTLHLTMFNEWANAGGLALVTALVAIVIHHGTATVSGTPQSGDVRKAPTEPIPGGDRKEDIKI